MRLQHRVLASFLSSGLMSTLVMVPAQAAGGCHNINAKANGQDAGGGVTHAQVIGGGLLQGTTDGNFTITGFTGAVASIAGAVTFTANNATLTVRSQARSTPAAARSMQAARCRRRRANLPAPPAICHSPASRT